MGNVFQGGEEMRAEAVVGEDLAEVGCSTEVDRRGVLRKLRGGGLRRGCGNLHRG